jgi:hypothetical protein
MIAVVSYDAGGAEIVSSWLRQNPQPYCLVLGGPAVAIFQRKLGDIEITTLANAIYLCEWVLCGTSWQSNLEKQAILQAKVASKKVIAFLDHWVNYSERFQLDGLTVLPDEIWVADIEAKILAQKISAEINVILMPNPYFKDLQIELHAVQVSSNDSNQCSVLFVCEPIREHALLVYGDEFHWGYTEKDALKFFLDNIAAIGTSISAINIRPHPSESKNKYNWARQENSLVKETDSTQSLLEQIAEADVVVGCESMAMVVALLAKKRVISSIPFGGKACALPQTEIENLQVLVANYRETLNAL